MQCQISIQLVHFHNYFIFISGRKWQTKWPPSAKSYINVYLEFDTHFLSLTCTAAWWSILVSADELAHSIFELLLSILSAKYLRIFWERFTILSECMATEQMEVFNEYKGRVRILMFFCRNHWVMYLGRRDEDEKPAQLLITLPLICNHCLRAYF